MGKLLDTITWLTLEKMHETMEKEGVIYSDLNANKHDSLEYDEYFSEASFSVTNSLPNSLALGSLITEILIENPLLESSCAPYQAGILQGDLHLYVKDAVEANLPN